MIIMSKEVVERIAQVTRQLYKLNLVSIFLCFIMWISSVWYAITMGLKYGLSFQVTTISQGNFRQHRVIGKFHFKT